jgi:hypothetical protein
MQNLRKNTAGYQSVWTDEELLSGLKYFYELEGHFPTSDEIDKFPYLPSARSIQRTHGGLVSLRKRLMPNEHHNFTTGEYRSTKAREADKRARVYEEEFYNFLDTHFESIAIHEHKIIRPGNVASDFFIYLNDKDGVVIDLFYAQDIRTLAKIVQIKLKRYTLLPFDTYFVLVGNPSITNLQIDERMQNRSTALPAHIKVVNERSFKDSIVLALKNRSRFAKT